MQNKGIYIKIQVVDYEKTNKTPKKVTALIRPK